VKGMVTSEAPTPVPVREIQRDELRQR
jgi:hypothetical protein